MADIPRIPVYSYSDVFFWPDEDGGGRGRFFNRLHSTKQCPFCITPLRTVIEISAKCTPDDYVVICDTCGFWFGRGWSEWIHGPKHLRGVVGLITFRHLNDLGIPTTELLTFLNKETKWLTHVNPFKAEELVCRLLQDAFGWEVRHIGGRRDEGVDALAVLTGQRRVIVQVKWRKDQRKAEAVSTVRELAGTLIARGIPRGLLVTTREHLSPAATREAYQIGRRKIARIGRLEIKWKTFSDILDMLQIASHRITSEKTVPFQNKDHGDFKIFDGGGVWDADWRYVKSEEERQRALAGDPYELLGKGLTL